MKKRRKNNEENESKRDRDGERVRDGAKETNKRWKMVLENEAM